MAIVCDGYPEIQVSKEHFAVIQRAIGGLVGELPEERFSSRLIDTYWTKVAPIMVCQNEETRNWLACKVPTLTAWGGSRLKMVGLDTLPTYKRVVIWVPVTTAWRVLRLLMEERPLIWRVTANILNKQSRQPTRSGPPGS